MGGSLNWKEENETKIKARTLCINKQILNSGEKKIPATDGITLKKGSQFLTPLKKTKVSPFANKI